MLIGYTVRDWTDMAKILVVEDDRDLALSIKEFLSAQQISAELAFDGNAGYEYIRQGQFDVIVLDWDLPGMSGIDICRQYRASQGSTPILMLTGKGLIGDKEKGFDAGADDYLTKPFNMRELCYRVKALARRQGAALNLTLQFKDIELDPSAHKVWKAGKPVHLLPKDFALLEFFMRYPQEVLSSEAIVQRVWSFDSDVTAGAVRTSILRLRKKLDDSDDEDSSFIENVRKIGYRLRST